MASFIEEYSKLLIKQYYNKAKARAEIESKAKRYEGLYEAIRQFPDQFDLDKATGNNLDLIGKIVNVSRSVNTVVAKIGFGFDENANSRGFADKFNNIDTSAPFQNRFTSGFTSLQLDDITYRLIIKTKIAVNNVTAYIVNDQKTSIQDVINSAFDGESWVIDNYDMSLSLYVPPSLEIERLRLIKELNLLPKPQAVNYNVIVSAKQGATFGFVSNQYSVGFGDRFGSKDGYFANKIIV